MKLKPIGSNQTVLELSDGTVILFSYSTPVAASTDDGFIRTKKHWGKTTSAHINRWLDGRAAQEVEQSTLDNLVKEA